VLVGSGDRQKGKIVRLQFRIDLQPVETLAEQAGSDEQDDGGGELDDDEIRSEAPPVQAGGTTFAFGQAGPDFDFPPCPSVPAIVN